MSLLSIGQHLTGLKDLVNGLNSKVQQAQAVLHHAMGARDQVAQIIHEIENPKPNVEDLPKLEDLIEAASDAKSIDTTVTNEAKKTTPKPSLSPQ